MADYSVDVKVKLDVKDIQNAINAKPIEATIVPKVVFNHNFSENDIKGVENAVQRYFNEESHKIGLRFKANEKTLQNDLDKIQSQINKVTSINIKTQLDDNFKQFKDDLLSIQYLTKNLKSKTIRLVFESPSQSQLSEIETKIENYFKNNPINLTFAKTEGINLQALDEKTRQWADSSVSETDRVQEHFLKLSDVIDQQKEALISQQQEAEKLGKIRDSYYENLKNKEADVSNSLYNTEKRQQQDAFYEEQKRHLEESTLIEKQILSDSINSHKNALDDKINSVIDAENKVREKLTETANIEKEIANKKDVVQAYVQKIKDIVDAYKNGETDIIETRNRIEQAMSESQKGGIIPQEVFDDTKTMLKALEEEADKSFEAWREKEAKAFEKSKKQTDEYKDYHEKLWEDQAKSVQNMYDKQQISAEKYAELMKELLPQAYEKGYTSADTYAKKLQEVEEKQQETSQGADKLGKSFDNMFGIMMRYFGVTKIFSAVSSSFSKMVTEVRNLDTELTEFSKVSDLSSQETEAFIDSAYNLGEAVAKTGTEVVTATTLFKKMGYAVDESMDFAKDALMWTNVADGMVSVEEAANMLISTMKAYGEETVSTTQIIDALNEVSNNYSTSSSALSNNLSTVAATLAASGTDLYQTIGLMTAGIEVMPDKASKVANGLKTISQRIRQIDGDTADKLDEFLGAKGKTRFDETTGQLKSTYDILSEVYELWGELTINERQYIGEVMAGKNQITVLNALMTNFAKAVDATGTAMNSAGSATRENERVLSSIQGHINAFKSAFSELSKDLIDSDLFKNIVDFGTRVLKFLDIIVKSKGQELISLVTGLGTALVSLKFASWAKQATSFFSSFGGGSLYITAATIALASFIDTMRIYSEITRQANEQTDNLIQLGSKGLPTENVDLEKTIKRYEELYSLLQKEQDIEKREQYAEELSQMQRELQYIGIDVDLINGKHDEQITKLKEELSLYREINYNNKKNNLENSSTFIGDVVSENKEGLGVVQTGLFANTPDKVAKRTEEASQRVSQINIGGETLKAVLDNDKLSIKEKQQALEDAYQEYQNKAIELHGEAENAIDEETRLSAEREEQRLLTDAGIIYQIFEKLQEQGEKYGEVVDAASVVVRDKLEKFGFDISSLTEEQLENLKEAIESDDLEDLDIPLNKLGISINELKTILSDPIQKDGFLKLIEDEELKKSIEDVVVASDDFGVSLSGAIAMLGDYASQAEILAQAQDDITNSGQITAETLKKIADAGLEAYLVYDEETKSLVVNTQAFFDNSAAQEDAAIAAYVAGEQAQLEADIQNILSGNLDTTTTALGTQDQALENNATAHKDAATAAAEYGAELEKNAILEGKYTDTQIAAVKARVDSYKQEVQAGIAAIQSFYQGVSNPRTATSRGASHSSGSSGSSSSSSRSSSSSDREASNAQREAEQAAKNAQKAWKDAFEIEYKKLKTYLDAELITHEEYYDALEELNKKFFKGRAEFEEEYWKYQDEIIKGRKKYLEDELSDYFKKGENILKHQLNVEYITEEEYYDALTLLYESYYTDKEKYEEEYWKLEEEIYKLRKKQIKELEDELSDLYDKIEDLHKDYIKSLEEDSEAIETTIGYAIDVLDEEIEKLKAEKTALNEANAALEEQIKLQELEDALEKAKQKKIRVYRKGQGFVYEQDTKAVGEAQSAIDEYKKELAHKKQLSMIDEEIAKLEEYKKAWKDITENYKRAQNEMTAIGVLGESAREKVLNLEYNAVEKVGIQYESVQKRIEIANNATIENLEEYIGDETTANTLSYEIKRIKDKIDEVQSKTVTLQVNTGTSAGNIQNIIDSITALKNKLEQSYSTNNLNSWLATWKNTINEAYQYSQEYGINPSGGGGSGSGGGGGSSGGFSVGDKVKFKDSLTNIPGTPNTIANAFWYNNGNYALDVIEIKNDGTLRIGQNGTIWYDVSPNDLVYTSDSSGGDDYGGGDGGDDYGEASYSVPVRDASGNIAGYNWYDSNGNLLYYEPAYASGTLGTTSKRFLVNENGLEAMVTPEGTVISAPTTGYGVINNKYTERLTDFASDPLAFLNKTFSGYSGIDNNKSVNEVININGNLNLPNVTDGESFIDSIRNVALQYTTRRK